MKKFLLLLVLPLVVISVSCSEKKQERINPAFHNYIQAFTAGPVSVQDPIRIRLTEEFVNDDQLNIPLEQELLSLSPSVEGKLCWLDRSTLEFRPDEPFPPDEKYQVTFHLSKLLDVPDSLSEFRFRFRTMRQDMEIITENHKAYSQSDLSREKIYGRILTADVTDDGKIPAVLKATQEGRELPVTWIHDSKTRTHFFQIDSVRRFSKISAVKIRWNGESIGADAEGEQVITIDPVGVFRCTGLRVVQGDEKYILAQFSDPLMEDQNLQGLISLGRKVFARNSIEDNELRIYPSEIKSREVTVSIHSALKNAAGKSLEKSLNEKVTWEETRPGIRFTGDGTIMPQSKQLLLPFEATGLKAADLKIIKIYENNILQFLQVNELNGQNNLTRVGRVVLNKTIPLREVADYNKWNRFSIDLSELINPEEGAMYCIKLDFRKEYSTWTCVGGNSSAPGTSMVVSKKIENNEGREYYYEYEDYYDYYEDGEEYYNWRDRDNPCKPSYYRNKSVSSNVLVSDFGMIAKDAGNGKLMVVVTDLKTAKPLSDVKLSIYNYQQQLLASGNTDGEGMAFIDVASRPWVVVARKDNGVGYLKLTGGKSLSLSMFDAGGEQVRKGLKGFLYGDRGVWRPGDSLFLTFILEDRQKQLPEGHPVTFTLSNPSGQIISRINRTRSLNGFYNFATSTAQDAPTGNWTARIKAGDAEFTKTLKIETVKPNRLKVALDFGTGRLFSSGKTTAKITSSWLTGAVADNLRTTVILSLSPSEITFAKLPGYIFEDPSIEFSSEKMTVFDGKLDAAGKAMFTPGIKLSGHAPGLLTANFETTVFEEGGDFSVDRFSIPYYPYSTYAGFYLVNSEKRSYYETGREYQVKVVNVDADGKPVTSGTVKVELLRLDWRWWWDNSNDGNGGFVSTAYRDITDSSTVRIQNGAGTYTLKMDDEDWGRYFIRITDKKSGHSAGKVLYFSSYADMQSDPGAKQAAAMLTFTTDKEKYRTGDKVKITFPSYEGARALLTLENSRGIIESYWINTAKGTTQFTFDVTPEMAPNCYASISLIQQHAQTVNDLPVRMYGVLPVIVEDPETYLKPVISVKNVLRPEEDCSITVREEKGNPMTYTLAVVDEGLLDLTRFKTPDPHGAFYAKEALGIQTWDLYDQVMGAWSGELQRILSIGGDKDALNRGALKANRFQPVVKFIGPFNLAGGASKTHSFRMPSYVGSVRIMVVAGDKGAYGSAEKTVPVKKPLMVLGTLPRMVSPGEEVLLPVTVFALEKNVRDVSVNISSNEFFSIIGSSSGKITFNRPDDKLLYFRLKVKNSVGIGKVNITAVSGNEKARAAIELDVRNPSVPVTEILEATIAPGKTWNGTFRIPGMAGTNSGALEVYSIPPMNLEKRLGYLITYPHGCSEQITSSVFPQLYLPDLIDLPDAGKQEIERNVREAIRRLQEFQSAGGIALWPGLSYSHDWTTCYVGHFLLEARQKGYEVPAGFLLSWKNAQREKALSWKYNENWYNSELVQAYRLFTLALAGSPEPGAMNLLLERKNLSLNARWRLAAAYVLSGKPEVALRLTANLGRDAKPYTDMETFGSEIRDEAMIIETLILMNRLNDASAMVRNLAARLSRDEWMSTQTTAFALMSVSRYSKGAGGSGMEIASRINSGKEIRSATAKSVITLPLEIRDKTASGTVQVINKGKSMVTARIVTTGIPEMTDSGSSESNLKMTIRYLSAKGNTIDPRSIPSGTAFYAEISISNPGMRGNYEMMALTQVVPSGWEIINARMSEYAAAATGASPFEYQDVRDDRVMTYFDLNRSTTKTFRVMLMATYAGHFYLPPLYCEAMYDNSIHAKLPGRWVDVTRADK